MSNDGWESVDQIPAANKWESVDQITNTADKWESVDQIPKKAQKPVAAMSKDAIFHDKASLAAEAAFASNKYLGRDTGQTQALQAKRLRDSFTRNPYLKTPEREAEATKLEKDAAFRLSKYLMLRESYNYDVSEADPNFAEQLVGGLGPSMVDEWNLVPVGKGKTLLGSGVKGAAAGLPLGIISAWEQGKHDVAMGLMKKDPDLKQLMEAGIDTALIVSALNMLTHGKGPKLEDRKPTIDPELQKKAAKFVEDQGPVNPEQGIDTKGVKGPYYNPKAEIPPDGELLKRYNDLTPANVKTINAMNENAAAAGRDQLAGPAELTNRPIESEINKPYWVDPELQDAIGDANRRANAIDNLPNAAEVKTPFTDIQSPYMSREQLIKAQDQVDKTGEPSHSYMEIPEEAGNVPYWPDATLQDAIAQANRVGGRRKAGPVDLERGNTFPDGPNEPPAGGGGAARGMAESSRMADLRNNAKFANELSQAKNAVDALTVALRYVKDEDLKKVAQNLFKYVSKDTQFHVMNPEDVASTKLDSAFRELDNKAVGLHITNEQGDSGIALRGSGYMLDQKKADGMSVEAVIHEVKHSVTDGAFYIASDPTFAKMPKYAPHVKYVRDVTQLMLDVINKITPEQYDKFKAAFKNAAEFNTYGWTNPEFRELLREVRVADRNKTGLAKFFEAIKAFFGRGSTDAGKALESFLNRLDEIQGVEKQDVGAIVAKLRDEGRAAVSSMSQKTDKLKLKGVDKILVENFEKELTELFGDKMWTSLYNKKTEWSDALSDAWKVMDRAISEGQFDNAPNRFFQAIFQSKKDKINKQLQRFHSVAVKGGMVPPNLSRLISGAYNKNPSNFKAISDTLIYEIQERINLNSTATITSFDRLVDQRSTAETKAWQLYYTLSAASLINKDPLVSLRKLTKEDFYTVWKLQKENPEAKLGNIFNVLDELNKVDLDKLPVWKKTDKGNWYHFTAGDENKIQNLAYSSWCLSRGYAPNYLNNNKDFKFFIKPGDKKATIAVVHERGDEGNIIEVQDIYNNKSVNKEHLDIYNETFTPNNNFQVKLRHVDDGNINNFGGGDPAGPVPLNVERLLLGYQSDTNAYKRDLITQAVQAMANNDPEFFASIMPKQLSVLSDGSLKVNNNHYWVGDIDGGTHFVSDSKLGEALQLFKFPKGAFFKHLGRKLNKLDDELNLIFHDTQYTQHEFYGVEDKIYEVKHYGSNKEQIKGLSAERDRLSNELDELKQKRKAVEHEMSKIREKREDLYAQVDKFSKEIDDFIFSHVKEVDDIRLILKRDWEGNLYFRENEVDNLNKYTGLKRIGEVYLDMDWALYNSIFRPEETSSVRDFVEQKYDMEQQKFVQQLQKQIKYLLTKYEIDSISMDRLSASWTVASDAAGPKERFEDQVLLNELLNDTNKKIINNYEGSRITQAAINRLINKQLEDTKIPSYLKVKKAPVYTRYQGGYIDFGAIAEAFKDLKHYIPMTFNQKVEFLKNPLLIKTYDLTREFYNKADERFNLYQVYLTPVKEFMENDKDGAIKMFKVLADMQDPELKADRQLAVVTNTRERFLVEHGMNPEHVPHAIKVLNVLSHIGKFDQEIAMENLGHNWHLEPMYFPREHTGQYTVQILDADGNLKAMAGFDSSAEAHKYQAAYETALQEAGHTGYTVTLDQHKINSLGDIYAMMSLQNNLPDFLKTINDKLLKEIEVAKRKFEMERSPEKIAGYTGESITTKGEQDRLFSLLQRRMEQSFSLEVKSNIIKNIKEKYLEDAALMADQPEHIKNLLHYFVAREIGLDVSLLAPLGKNVDEIVHTFGKQVDRFAGQLMGYKGGDVSYWSPDVIRQTAQSYTWLISLFKLALSPATLTANASTLAMTPFDGFRTAFKEGVHPLIPNLAFMKSLTHMADKDSIMFLKQAKLDGMVTPRMSDPLTLIPTHETNKVDRVVNAPRDWLETKTNETGLIFYYHYYSLTRPELNPLSSEFKNLVYKAVRSWTGDYTPSAQVMGISQLGAVGQLSSNFAKWKYNQLGRLMNDLQDASAGNLGPLFVSMAITLAMAGLAGAAFLVEYEALRRGLQKLGIADLKPLNAMLYEGKDWAKENYGDKGELAADVAIKGPIAVISREIGEEFGVTAPDLSNNLRYSAMFDASTLPFQFAEDVYKGASWSVKELMRVMGFGYGATDQEYKEATKALPTVAGNAIRQAINEKLGGEVSQYPTQDKGDIRLTDQEKKLAYIGMRSMRTNEDKDRAYAKDWAERYEKKQIGKLTNQLIASVDRHPEQVKDIVKDIYDLKGQEGIDRAIAELIKRKEDRATDYRERKTIEAVNNDDPVALSKALNALKNFRSAK